MRRVRTSFKRHLITCIGLAVVGPMPLVEVRAYQRSLWKKDVDELRCIYAALLEKRKEGLHHA